MAARHGGGRRGPLSAAHKAAISASLKRRGSKNAQPSSRFRRAVVSSSAPAMANRPTKGASTKYQIKRAGGRTQAHKNASPSAQKQRNIAGLSAALKHVGTSSPSTSAILARNLTRTTGRGVSKKVIRR